LQALTCNLHEDEIQMKFEEIGKFKQYFKPQQYTKVEYFEQKEAT
jgi:hypothetical protein